MARPKLPFPENLLRRLEFQPPTVMPTGCIVYTGGTNGVGYGLVHCPDKDQPKQYAHRIVYEWLHGPIPDGLQIDHLCRNRACVLHLEAVTSRENSLRGVSPHAANARKTHCIHGHPLSGDNLYLRANGYRSCRKCHRDRERRKYQAQNTEG